MSIENSYFLENIELDFPVLTITGTCRSGKTLIGKLLGTCNQTEYADEPYTCMMLPMIVKSGKINEEFAIGWMRANIRELFNDLVHLRSVNFRSEDLSSIWSMKSPEEIFARMTSIKTRGDASAFAKRNNSHLVVTLSESMPFIEFIIKAIPHIKFINVVRDPFAVAKDLVAKKWFSDEQLKNPLMAQLYCVHEHLGSNWYMPWWVDDEEHEYFIKLSEYDRGMYYWWSLMNKGLKSIYSTKCDMIQISYEELIKNPKYVFENLINILNFSPGPLTYQKLSEVRSEDYTNLRISIDQELENRILKLKEKINEK